MDGLCLVKREAFDEEMGRAVLVVVLSVIIDSDHGLESEWFLA